MLDSLDLPLGRQTLFAPDNAAFGDNTEYVTKIVQDPDYRVHAVTLLANHLAGNILTLAVLREVTFVATLARESLTFDESDNDDSVLINTQASRVPAFEDLNIPPAVIIQGDILASNGVIHVTDEVLYPVWFFQSHFDSLVLEGNFEILLELIVATDLEDTVRNLQDSTLIAPNDEALDMFGRDFLRFLEDNPTITRQLILYHILPEVVNFEILLPGASENVVSLQGEEVTVFAVPTSATSTRLRFNGIRTQSTELVQQGFVYEIPGVLVPPSLIESIPGLSELLQLTTDTEGDAFFTLNSNDRTGGVMEGTAIPIGDRIGSVLEGTAIPASPPAASNNQVIPLPRESATDTLFAQLTDANGLILGQADMTPDLVEAITQQLVATNPSVVNIANAFGL